LLSYELEYNRRSEYPEDPTRDLLMLFANISHKIEAREARESECMGAFAEAIVAEGQERAAQRFPDVATHLSICSDCCSVLEATVASVIGEEETD
jgi:hypothetical protein